MDVVPSFLDLLQAIAVVMHAPTQATFVQLATGWLFARKRTVTQMIVCSGAQELKHFGSFHRFFSAAAWSLDAVGIAVFGLLAPLLPEGPVFLIVDDTLARKGGRKIFGAGWHHDPLTKDVKAKTSWGHSWVVLAVSLKFAALPRRTFCLPPMFRLYLNHKEADKRRRAHRTRPELALQMVQKLCRLQKCRTFHLLGDSAYGGRGVRDGLPSNCELTSVLRLDARLYDAPAPQTGRGRRRRRGERLPSPQEMLDGRLRHAEIEVYGRSDQVRIGSCVARTNQHPEQPLRVVAVESRVKNRGRQAIFSTVAEASDEQVLQWYCMRWTVEVTFQCSKQHLGFEEPPCWSRRSVERTAPVAMLLYSLVLLWFSTKGHAAWKLSTTPWYPQKQQPSFADMLVALRQQCIKSHLKSLALPGAERRKIMKLLQNTAALAA